METSKPITLLKAPPAVKAPQTFAPDAFKDAPVVTPAPVEEEVAKPATEDAPKPIQYPSLYQPSGHDPYHGKGGTYELDPETGVRRPK